MWSLGMGRDKKGRDGCCRILSGTIPSGERVAADAWTVCGTLIEVYKLFCCDDREL